MPAKTETFALTQAWNPHRAIFPAGSVTISTRKDRWLFETTLQDADISSTATDHQQPMWELGDTLEIFAETEGAPRYHEFHVTPTRKALQLTFEHRELATRRHRPISDFYDWHDDFLWSVYFEPGIWKVHATLPAILSTKRPLRFSVSRYDAGPHRPPILSSTSPHLILDFHRREDWRTIQPH